MANKVFISYRRADSATISGRIYDRLVLRFGRKNVFKDVDDIPAGVNFGTYIQDSLRQCAVMLVIIGPDWAGTSTADSGRRLDSSTDWVRLEVETALSLGLTVIPLLVGGASMPHAATLPDSLQELTRINSLRVRDDPDFATDMGRAISALERAFAIRPSAGRRGSSSRASQSPPASRPAASPPIIPAGSAAPTAQETTGALPARQQRPSSAPVTVARIWRWVGVVAIVLVVVPIALLLSTHLPQRTSSNNTGGNQPVRGGTLNLGLESDLNTLDPLKSGLLVERQVLLSMYDTLVRVDATNSIKPDLATSWTYSTDNKTLTFTLRSDVKFQDGTPFNADAVVFNINRYLTTIGSARISDISTISSVKAVDPTHVQFNLKQPFAPLLATLTDRAGMMLSPTALQAAGADPTNKPTNLGSGPFSFKEWTKGDHLSIVRNPTYWGKDSSGGALPYLDGVTYKIITDTSVMYQNLQSGSIQVARVLSPTDVATAKANSSLTYKQIPGLSFVGFELNTKNAPLDDVHVRRAIAWAINPDEIIHNALNDIAVKSNGPIPPSSWAYDATIAPFHHDVNQAKAELALASNHTPTFELKISSGDQTTANEAQFIQRELQAADITVIIKAETFGTILTETNTFNFQAALIGWSGRVDPDGNMYSWFHTSQTFNYMQYSNATVDQLLDDARVQTTQATRATDYQNAEKQIVQDASYIFIYHGVSQQISSNKVHGFTLAPTTIIDCSTSYLH